jgi:hypothetical protein
MKTNKQDTKRNSMLSPSFNSILGGFTSSHEFDDFMPDRRLRFSSCNLPTRLERGLPQIEVKSTPAKPELRT